MFANGINDSFVTTNRLFELSVKVPVPTSIFCGQGTIAGGVSTASAQQLLDIAASKQQAIAPISGFRCRIEFLIRFKTIESL
jgi:hypothetical protein